MLPHIPLKPRKRPWRNVAYYLWGPTCTILAWGRHTLSWEAAPAA